MTQRYAPGDTIICEGDDADFVYTLRSGRAEASQCGVRVGDILSGEVFGALAAFSGLQRNATVTARTICLVEAVDKDNFISLAQQQPELCVKLINDMSRLICDLNESILALSAPTLQRRE